MTFKSERARYAFRMLLGASGICLGLAVILFPVSYAATRFAIVIGSALFIGALATWMTDGGVPLNSTQTEDGGNTQDAEK